MPVHTSNRWAAEAAKQKAKKASTIAAAVMQLDDVAPVVASRDFAVEKWLDALGPGFSSTTYTLEEVSTLQSMALTMDRLVDGRNIQQSEVPSVSQRKPSLIIPGTMLIQAKCMVIAALATIRKLNAKGIGVKEEREFEATGDKMKKGDEEEDTEKEVPPLLGLCALCSSMGGGRNTHTTPMNRGARLCTSS